MRAPVPSGRRSARLAAAFLLSHWAASAAAQSVDVQAPAPGNAGAPGAAGVGPLNSGAGNPAGGIELQPPAGAAHWKTAPPPAVVRGAAPSSPRSPVVGAGEPVSGRAPPAAGPVPSAAPVPAAAGPASRINADGGSAASPAASSSGRPSAVALSPGKTADPSAPRAAAGAATSPGTVGAADPAGSAAGTPAGRVRLEIQEIGRSFGKASEAQARGDGAAIQSVLSRFFEAQRRKAAAEPGDDGPARAGSGGLGRKAGPEGGSAVEADDARLGPGESIRKITELAQVADPADAPMLYRRALDTAFTAFPEAEAQRQGEAIFRTAARQAPRAIRAASRRALEDAARGALTGRRREKAFDALEFWNAHLVLSGARYVANLAELEAAIRLVSEASPAGTKRTSPPGVRFVDAAEEHGKAAVASARSGRGAAPGGNMRQAPRERKYALRAARVLGPGVRAVVRLPSDYAGVREVTPAALSFDLKPAALAAMDLEGPSPLAAAFDLEPEGRAAFRAGFAARRAAGRSVLASAWISMGRRATSEAAGIWLRLRRLVLRLLGLDRAPSAGEPAVRVDALGKELEAGRGEPVDFRRGGGGAARVARSPLGARHEPVRARFAAFDAVMKGTLAALKPIARDAERVTLGSAKASHAAAAASAAAFARWTGDGAPAAELERIWRQVAEKAAGLSDRDALPREAARLVVSGDRPSLLRFAGLLREAALDRLGRGASAAPANALARVEAPGGKTREAAFLELSVNPSPAGARGPGAVLRALLETMAGPGGLPRGSMVVQDSRFWGRFVFRGAGAEIYAEIRPPEEGGTVRVRYEESNEGLGARARLYYAARYLYGLGLAVRLDNGGVSAVVDKDGEAHGRDRLEDDFAGAMRLLSSLDGLDASLARVLEGSISGEENSRRIDREVRRALPEDPAESGEPQALSGPEREEVHLGRGVVVSAGDGRIVEGIATYNRDKAAQGGYIFVTPFADDLKAVASSRGVLATSAGELSQTAIAAREAGVPAVVFGRARWTPSGVDLGGGGRSVILREGALVRLDPSDGAVAVRQPPRISASSVRLPIPPR